jgi:hypothetical protein
MVRSLARHRRLCPQNSFRNLDRDRDKYAQSYNYTQVRGSWRGDAKRLEHARNLYQANGKCQSAYNAQEERFMGGTWKMLYFNDRKLRARISSMSSYMKKIFVLASSTLQKF